MTIKIFAVGDVCGKGGVEFLRRNLRQFQKSEGIGFTVVNGENANVLGATPNQCEAMLSAGADVITLGNHTWAYKDLRGYLDRSPRCLRPVNFAPQCPGRGWGEFDSDFGRVCVINAMGRFSLDPNTDNPFRIVESVVGQTKAKIILIDFHAEATSEKGAMAHYLDGRASVVWGTHTHVQTSDARVLSGGTGFITDLGMTGPIDSILGVNSDQSVRRFLGDPPKHYRSAEGPCKLEGAVFEIDADTGHCLSARSVRLT